MRNERDPQQYRARPNTRQDGAVMVEFALVLPLLLLLVFGIFEFGRAMNYWIDQTHLANIGARFAAVDRNPNSEGTLQEWIRDQANTEELRSGDTDSEPVEVCIEFLGAEEVGEPVETKVSFLYDWMPFLSEALGGLTETELTGKATMRLEQVPSEYAANPC